MGEERARRLPAWLSRGVMGIILATFFSDVGHEMVTTVLRVAAWVGRGFRGPLRDFLLADEVEPTHFGRAYGVERTADMLGAVTGPLVALVMLAAGAPIVLVIAVSFGPSLLGDLHPALHARPRAHRSGSCRRRREPRAPAALLAARRRRVALLSSGRGRMAFAIAGSLGALGTIWVFFVGRGLAQKARTE